MSHSTRDELLDSLDAIGVSLLLQNAEADIVYAALQRILTPIADGSMPLRQLKELVR